MSAPTDPRRATAARLGPLARARLRLVFALVLKTALILGVLFLGYYCYWTFLDPRVNVPPPVVLRVSGASNGQRATVLLLGDLATTDAALSLVKQSGFDYPYRATLPLLASADAVVANLEAPLTTSETPWPVPKPCVYKVPPEAAAAIRNAGIDAVTLANNHLNDYCSRGIRDTLENLSRVGISYLGAGLSEAEARRGLVLDTAGGKVGLLSVLEDKLHWRLWVLLFALDAPFHSWPGAARLTYQDVQEDIARLKKHADAVIVVPHWGTNYAPITLNQERLGRAMIDDGADAVIGHHPHIAQPVELYRGRPIVYSLGNYAFGTLGPAALRHGMGATLHLESGHLTGIDFTPLMVQNRVAKYQPQIAHGAEFSRFAKEIVQASSARGAVLETRGEQLYLPLADRSGSASGSKAVR